MEWKETHLGLISESIQTGPFGSQLHQYDYSEKGTPVIMPKDMIGSSLIEDSIARISNNHVQRLKKHIVKTGDIIYSRRGDVGRCVLISSKENGWICGTGCLKVTLDIKKVVPSFIFYVLQRKESVEWVENHAVGATMPNLNTGILSSLPIVIPPRSTQQMIVSILSNYDTLIDINTKRIKLLEESARELYKEWFVRMRFPGYEKAKFVKGIPVGWDVKTIDEICDSVGGGTPSTSNANYWGGKIKWVTPTDITSKQSLPLINIEGRITEAGLRQSSTKLLPAGAILMTSRASIGFFGICKEQVCTNQGFISIIPNEENLRMYMLCNLMMRREEIISNANGATFLEISKGRFRKMEMLIPNNDVLSAFEERCSTTFDAVYNLEIQNQVLAATRDRLLPRLLSGELKVKA
jgi:type I restriction enzyme S subunit